MKIEHTESWFEARNLFTDPSHLPASGEYEGMFIGILPAPKGWTDKKAARYCFLMIYDGREICPCFLNRERPRTGLAVSLFHVLIGEGSRLPEEVRWNLLAGRSLRIQVERSRSKSTGKYFLRVIDVHPLKEAMI